MKIYKHIKKIIVSALVISAVIPSPVWAQTGDIPINLSDLYTTIPEYAQISDQTLNRGDGSYSFTPLSQLNPYSSLSPQEQIERYQTDLPRLHQAMLEYQAEMFNAGDIYDNDYDSILSWNYWASWFSEDDFTDAELQTLLLQQRLMEVDQQINLISAQVARANGDEDQALIFERQAQSASSTVSNIQRSSAPALDDVKVRESQKRCVSLLDGFDISICIANGLEVIFGIIIWVYSLVLELMSNIFTVVIDFTILRFKEFADEMGIVNIGWRLSRDIANIFFIFILLHLAIATVLQISKTDTKKALVNILIMALIINFSATFTRVAIDASNIGALTFYGMIGKEDQSPNIATPFTNSISFFQNTNPQEIDADGFSQSMQEVLSVVAKYLGMMVLLTVTIFVIGAAIILFTIRGVSLLILLMSAPLAILGWGFAPLKEVWTMWKNRLQCDILFAPIFMFFLYITFAIMEKLYGPEGAVTKGVIPNDSIPAQIFIFLILNGLMLGGLLIAQKVGCQMAGDMYKRAKGVATKTTKALTSKPAGYAARSSIGRAAREMNRSETMQKIAAKSPLVGGALKSGLDKVGSVKFGMKDGYNEALDKKQKRQKEIFNSIKNSELKAQYLQNLSGKRDVLGRGKRDRGKLYEELSDREKADLEIKNLDNAPNREMIRELRNGLPEEKKESANKVFGEQLRRFVQYEGGKELSIKEQYNKFRQLEDEDDRKTVYGNLSDIDKVNLEREAEEQAKAAREKEERGEETNEEEKAQISISNEIKALRQEYREIGEKGQKIDKAESEMDKRLRNKESREIVAKLTEIAKNIKGGRESNEDRAYIAEKIKKLSGGETAALPTELLAHKSAAPHINVKVVKQIQKSDMPIEEYEAIIKNLGQNGNQEVQDYINYGVDTNTRGNQARRRGSETSLEQAQRESRERAQNSQPAADPNNDAGRPDSN